jgi:addiction module HigA family antidote
MYPKNRQPYKPSDAIRTDILERHNLTQDQLAKELGVSRLSISQLVNDRRGVTADMALRLARLTNTDPKTWLNLQAAVDLWNADQKHAGQLSNIKPLPQTSRT